MRLGPTSRSVSASSAPESDVVDAIYDSAQAGDTGSEDFGPLLAKITGSSDSEVQAVRAGALKPNITAGAMLVDPPGSDASDVEGAAGLEGGGSSGAPAQRIKPSTLSGESSSDNSESDGEGATGLVAGDVSMMTAAASGSSGEEGEEDDEDEDGGDGGEEGEEEGEEGDEEGGEEEGEEGDDSEA